MRMMIRTTVPIPMYMVNLSVRGTSSTYQIIVEWGRQESNPRVSRLKAGYKANVCYTPKVCGSPNGI